ncbi:hypothetical protein EV360DRAFT_89425 [Lentinula raphanica]|nr:hypothetical protein EV360DRAFT_89425 [Lentinula raphanica]
MQLRLFGVGSNFKIYLVLILGLCPLVYTAPVPMSEKLPIASLNPDEEIVNIYFQLGPLQYHFLSQAEGRSVKSVIDSEMKRRTKCTKVVFENFVPTWSNNELSYIAEMKHEGISYTASGKLLKKTVKEKDGTESQSIDVGELEDFKVQTPPGPLSTSLYQIQNP